ncbi:MAG: DUF1559 domain-containing protein, partial [Planctomycetota bacterium]
APGPPVGFSRHRLSFLVSILPFVEQQAMWEQVSNGGVDENNFIWPPSGPAPYTVRFRPWATDVPTYRCPSDPGRGLPAVGRTNYVACIGDSTNRMVLGGARFNGGMSAWEYEIPSWLAQQVRAAGRGAFVARSDRKFRDILDGLSNTIVAGEIATDLGDSDIRTRPSIQNGGHGGNWGVGIMLNPETCALGNQFDPERPRFWAVAGGGGTPPMLPGQGAGRGYRWADCEGIYGMFNTILPPNSELCLGGGHNTAGIMSASSRHPGGVHVLMGDGAVKFITDSIEAGDPQAETVWRQNAGNVSSNPPGSPSPYGLWGALGTRANGEVIEEEL